MDGLCICVSICQGDLMLPQRHWQHPCLRYSHSKETFEYPMLFLYSSTSNCFFTPEEKKLNKGFTVESASCCTVAGLCTGWGLRLLAQQSDCGRTGLSPASNRSLRRSSGEIESCLFCLYLHACSVPLPNQTFKSRSQWDTNTLVFSFPLIIIPVYSSGSHLHIYFFLPLKCTFVYSKRGECLS